MLISKKVHLEIWNTWLTYRHSIEVKLVVTLLLEVGSFSDKVELLLVLFYISKNDITLFSDFGFLQSLEADSSLRFEYFNRVVFINWFYCNGNRSF